ncbi:Serpentine Receptor, class D (Delta) [Caenorhabditis elegans]|uniref:Serpentine Receptor, class D (Delta) n=1 Tax=Caenorhabditis elegans TaxID=6239 RepID=O45326_CAEEL|nr:Serpentine Receptor, class D (Delta) [Caenorhabditis elegans]CAB04066.2 Serpentine Receptor, class D (Delta) [Caenorhabditis elegans]|eukprot:NP_507271.2 Serpentine Receptor, class D (delta) [Caenorhabditis elegans]
MDPEYQFLQVYWLAFFITCSLLYFTMYILIFNFTTKDLRTMKYFLYPSNTAMMISIGMGFATQAKKINNKESIALLCDGICKYAGPTFCYHCYNLWKSFGIVVCLINLHMLYYRAMSLKYMDTKKALLRTKLFSLHYLFPLLFQTQTFIPRQNHAQVHKETMQRHPQDNYAPYLDFGGFSEAQKAYLDVSTVFLVLGSVYCPFAGLYCKYQALSMLKPHLSPNTSSATRAMLRTLIKGLNYQILLPLLSYIPNTSLVILNAVLEKQVPISQYTIVFGSMSCVLEPFVQIYFITPYRRAIGRLCNCCFRRVLAPNNEPPNVDSTL